MRVLATGISSLLILPPLYVYRLCPTTVLKHPKSMRFGVLTAVKIIIYTYTKQHVKLKVLIMQPLRCHIGAEKSKNLNGTVIKQSPNFIYFSVNVTLLLIRFPNLEHFQSIYCHLYIMTVSRVPVIKQECPLYFICVYI
jgi:hypothetical protein